jgi:hypothetical protein
MQGCGKEVYRAKLSRIFEGRTFGQVWPRMPLVWLEYGWPKHNDSSGIQYLELKTRGWASQQRFSGSTKIYNLIICFKVIFWPFPKL